MASSPIISGSEKSKFAGMKSLDGFSIIFTVLVATTAAVICSSVFYQTMFDISFWLKEQSVPVDTCVVIAFFSGVAGLFGFALQSFCCAEKEQMPNAMDVTAADTEDDTLSAGEE